MNALTEPQHFPLYPATAPFRTERLQVSGGHDLHFEECRSTVGKPVVVLPGGPGAGAAPVMRRFHDPKLYRIVLFDQRSCRRSLTHASIENNTTWDLVADIEALRGHLDIESWQVFGGSWGSALALAYAQTQPDRVRELILLGIFLMRRSELDWFYRDGCNWLFPEAFAEFTRAIPETGRGDMIAAYYKRLTSSDKDLRLAAALRVVSDAGHAMTQPGIVHAPIAATRMYAGD